MKATLNSSNNQNVTVTKTGFDTQFTGAVINKTVKQNITVSNVDGSLQSFNPITLKNQISEIQSIEDIRDVAEVDVSDGSTLIYNSVNDKYEIRKLQARDITGTFNLDGGEF